MRRRRLRSVLRSNFESVKRDFFLLFKPHANEFLENIHENFCVFFDLKQQMQRSAKQQKLDGEHTSWLESESLALRHAVLSCTPLPDVICGVVEEFAVLRKRFAIGVDLKLTRSRYQFTTERRTSLRPWPTHGAV